MLCLGLALTGVMRVQAGDSPSARERSSFDAGWRFAFGHPFDPARDFNHGTGYFSYFAKAGYGDGPAAAKFTSWNFGRASCTR